MTRLLIFSASLVACIATTSAAQALTVGYGQRDIADAGPGCVGGWLSAHGDTAFYSGATELLNSHLASLAANSPSGTHITVVLHSGDVHVENPEEKPQTGFGEQESNELSIDWSTKKTCPPDDILTGRCKCKHRNVTVDVWIANDIRLRELSIPNSFSVKSGGEIQRFIDSHGTRN
ncbi:hypothetical protein [Crateriforma conspicua]|uniref:Secreted protein n=1 Tax=Crateriforma conspicua TaxID=2527996 RepID=A0A5C6FM46_9PLAN|nr:hypothetical protein [Crateriforma conspicua]TWU60909.1 hypothetical protein V7x_52170 [Crateriforma conspicua]